MSESYPVTITRSTGEVVRIGTATRTATGFSLSLGSLAIGGTAVPAAPASSGPLLPNYGRSKSMPIAGAAVAELQYYADGCRRSIADPSKSQYHQKERATLAAIEAELARHGHGPPAEAEGDPGAGDGERW